MLGDDIDEEQDGAEQDGAQSERARKLIVNNILIHLVKTQRPEQVAATWNQYQCPKLIDSLILFFAYLVRPYGCRYNALLLPALAVLQHVDDTLRDSILGARIAPVWVEVENEAEVADYDARGWLDTVVGNAIDITPAHTILEKAFDADDQDTLVTLANLKAIRLPWLIFTGVWEKDFIYYALNKIERLLGEADAGSDSSVTLSQFSRKCNFLRTVFAALHASSVPPQIKRHLEGQICSDIAESYTASTSAYGGRRDSLVIFAAERVGIGILFNPEPEGGTAFNELLEKGSEALLRKLFLLPDFDFSRTHTIGKYTFSGNHRCTSTAPLTLPIVAIPFVIKDAERRAWLVRLMQECGAKWVELSAGAREKLGEEVYNEYLELCAPIRSRGLLAQWSTAQQDINDGWKPQGSTPEADLWNALPQTVVKGVLKCLRECRTSDADSTSEAGGR